MASIDLQSVIMGPRKEIPTFRALVTELWWFFKS